MQKPIAFEVIASFLLILSIYQQTAYLSIVGLSLFGKYTAFI